MNNAQGRDGSHEPSPAESKRDRPYVLGITGSIGSGKSAVGLILSDEGVPVLDTDKIVHDLLTTDTPVRKAVVERFGKEIVTTDPGSPKGAIDRKLLGAVVFDDEKMRRDLESIVHPNVLLECRKRIAGFADSPIVAVLVPLLFEANVQKEYDEIWTVVANQQVLRERLKKRDSLSDAEIDKRISAQMPQEKKAALSKVVIDNSGSLDDTRRQVLLNLGIARSGLK